MIYAVCVALGALFGLVATRFLPPDARVPDEVARSVRRAALVGAVLGAYLFELPADICHWAAVPEPYAHAGASPLFGRTVLGGVLGGWGAVELAKWRAGFRGATGDRFAVPLAIALAFGRIGCTLTGCCPGVPIERGTWLAGLSFVHHDPPRFPATLVEAYFHATSAVLLVLASRAGVLRGRRLAAYLTAYAVVRFALEHVRDNARIALGLSYYQFLAVALFALAGGTWLKRSLPRELSAAATSPRAESPGPAPR